MTQTNRLKLVFATNNAHKLEEIRQIAGDRVEVLSLDDIGCHDDIPENEPTLQGNALVKARWISQRYGVDCFADDTGLEVEALDDAPGVMTARYAGPAHDSDANMNLLLQNMQGLTNRRARFRTVIALILNGQEHCFEGEVRGSIAKSKSGCAGFGYDPVFIPEGDIRTFAEYTADEKNAISHRSRAAQKLFDFLYADNNDKK